MNADNQAREYFQLTKEEIVKQQNSIVELGKIKTIAQLNLFQIFNKVIIEYILSNFIITF